MPSYLKPTLHRRFHTVPRSLLRFGLFYHLAPHLPHLDSPVPGQYKVPVCPQLGQHSFLHSPPAAIPFFSSCFLIRKSTRFVSAFSPLIVSSP